MSNTEINPEDLTIAEGESYTEWLTEMADVIREKTDTTAKIKPVAFPTKMKQISSGGLFKLSNNRNTKKFEMNYIPSHFAYNNSGIFSSGASYFVSSVTNTVHNYLTGDVSIISDYGFQSANLITDVSFKKCTRMGWMAFKSNSYLRSAYFPECQEFGSYAFHHVQTLNSIYAPKCNTIQEGAFGGNITNFVGETNVPVSPMKLVNVNLGSPESIGSSAFYYQSLMTSGLSFSKTKYIGMYAFYSCSVFEVPIDAPVCSFVGSNVLFSNSKVSYAYLPSLKQNWHASVSTSYDYVNMYNTFMSALGLEFAYISFVGKFSSSTNYASSPFMFCPKLTNIVLRNFCWLPTYMFYGTTSLRSVFLWNDTRTDYISALSMSALVGLGNSVKFVVPSFAYASQIKTFGTTSVVSMTESAFKARVKELVDGYRGVDTSLW